MLLTLPNAITFARLCAVPATVWLMLRHDLHAAFAVFVAAGLSDAVDGWLARRRGGGNAIGAVLDPVADKALLVSMYVTLAAVGVLPDWLAILVVFRDVVIVGGVLVLAVLGHAVRIRPLLVSKLNTAMQIVLVAVALLLHGFDAARAGAARRAGLDGGGDHARLRRRLCLVGGAPAGDGRVMSTRCRRPRRRRSPCRARAGARDAAAAPARHPRRSGSRC